MTDDPRKTIDPGFEVRLARRRILARLALAWERTAGALWSAATIAALFAALSLLDLGSAIPVWLHGLALIGFTAALVWTAWRGARRLKIPSDAEGERRQMPAGLEVQLRPRGSCRWQLSRGKSAWTADLATGPAVCSSGAGAPERKTVPRRKRVGSHSEMR